LAWYFACKAQDFVAKGRRDAENKLGLEAIHEGPDRSHPSSRLALKKYAQSSGRNKPHPTRDLPPTFLINQDSASQLHGQGDGFRLAIS
jgi:hypothetical protein